MRYGSHSYTAEKTPEPEAPVPVCPICKGEGSLYWLLGVQCYECGGDKTAPMIDRIRIK